MNKYIIILFALLLSVPVQAQTTVFTNGIQVNYDTTGMFAHTTLIGAKGVMKRIGTIDMRNGLAVADSFALHVAHSDSVVYALVVRPVNSYKAGTSQDTTGRVTPAAGHLLFTQNGTGVVSYPWFRIRGAITDLTKDAPIYEVWLRINKTAGLHTYGTASTGKAAGKMTITAVRYY